MNPSVPSSAPKSAVLHSMAGYYDLLVALVTLGRERELRERLAALASISPGESVLDIGCGTGSLAIAAKGRVGDAGIVVGIDAAPEMIERARQKAAKAGLTIQFETAGVEALPFADATFDVVLSTLMMHHLPRAIRERCAAEALRVLRPGGRMLVVDFEKPANGRGGLISRLHRHGHVPMRDIIELLRRTDLRVTETGSLGVSDLHFAVATRPYSGSDADRQSPPTERALPPLPRPKWLVRSLVVMALFAAVVVAVVVHLSMMQWALGVLALGTLASVAVIGAVLAHTGVVGGVIAIARRHHRR